MAIGIGAALLLAAASLFVLFLRPAAAVEPGDSRLITIYDRGEEQVVVSNAATLREALEKAEVTLDAKDAVEPSLDEELVASEYKVNIYRARPVTVIDGATKQRVVTPYQTAEQIIKDVGINLFTEDITTMKQSEDIVADGAGLRLTIDRATPLVLDLYGKTAEIRTQGVTVGEMLKEKKLALGENDRLSVSEDTPITAGLQIRLWREGKQTVTVDEAIAFGTEKVRDADRDPSYKEVRTPGKDGKRTVTYEIHVENGVEVSRAEIASVTVEESVTQVEVIGTKVALTVKYSADRAAIMTAAGVALADQDYAAYIINNENALWCPIRWQGTSGCGTSYYEKFEGAESSSQVGYGLCQATPGIKMATAGADWRTNVITQMKWCHQYAIGRYKTWQAAYEFKVRMGWW